MRPADTPWIRRRGWRAAAGAGLLLGGAIGAAAEAPVLYRGEGGWGAVTGLSAAATPPSEAWGFENGLWIGRIPGGAGRLSFGEAELDAAGAPPPPLAPGRLPALRNAFGDCLVRSLSIRFESQIRAHRWSLVFPPEGTDPEFFPLSLRDGVEVDLALSVEDADTGEVWALRPERMGIEGGMFDEERGDTRLYAGWLDGQHVEWHVVVARSPAGRRIVQGRLRTFSGPPRRLRWSVGVEAGAPGRPVLQEEFPPAVVAVRGESALAMFADLAEPRRFRALPPEEGRAGMEFDLAVTRATGNFPRSATFSVEVEAWPTAGEEAAAAEAASRLGSLAAGHSLPPAVRRGEWADAAVFIPSRHGLSHPGGFRDEADVLQHLLFRTGGLFDDRDWHASAFLCLAQDAEGHPYLARDGDAAVLAVNADPDLETLAEVGQNRGLTLLQRVLRRKAPAVFVRAAGTMPGLDHHVRALYLCDYPAVWEEKTGLIGVEVRHAEAELIASLACVLKERGVCLMVGDGGPLAPFTTAHADALVCESADPAEMRRQHALAGGRPVAWAPAEADDGARALAHDLDFVILPALEEE
ncbi:MAG: hypothetical protein GX548_01225 [Lentisphaerae bacterium]|nr:hypothetical protein [Lentisphaerota bacterium]